MTSPPRSPVVFVAEDDAGVRELVRTRLENAGYHTRWAGNGHDAYEQCRRARPDAIVLDVNMPGLDGFGLLERWRRVGGELPPTLMLTARHCAEDVRRALALGARDFLTKPFDDQKLLTRVARLLRPVKPVSVPGPDSVWL